MSNRVLWDLIQVRRLCARAPRPQSDASCPPPACVQFIRRNARVKVSVYGDYQEARSSKEGWQFKKPGQPDGQFVSRPGLHPRLITRKPEGKFGKPSRIGTVRIPPYKVFSRQFRKHTDAFRSRRLP